MTRPSDFRDREIRRPLDKPMDYTNLDVDDVGLRGLSLLGDRSSKSKRGFVYLLESF